MGEEQIRNEEEVDLEESKDEKDTLTEEELGIAGGAEAAMKKVHT